jgi:hypothetical protein
MRTKPVRPHETDLSACGAVLDIRAAVEHTADVECKRSGDREAGVVDTRDDEEGDDRGCRLKEILVDKTRGTVKICGKPWETVGNSTKRAFTNANKGIAIFKWGN